MQPDKHKNTLTVQTTIREFLPNLPESSVNIYDAYLFDPKFKNFSKQDKSTLIATLGEWGTHLGVELTPDQLIIIQSFITDNFKTYTNRDVKECMKLALNNAWGKNLFFNGKFTTAYVSMALNLYRENRDKTIIDIRNVIKKRENQQTKKATPEEQLENLKLILKDAFDATKKGYYYYDFHSIVYNFLTDNKLIKFTEKLKQDAERHAKYSLGKDKKRDALRQLAITPDINKTNKIAQEQQYKREYAVHAYFKKLNKKDFDKLINSLKMVKSENQEIK